MSRSGSFTSALASASGRSRTIDTVLMGTVMGKEMMWRAAISIPSAQGICIVIVVTWNVRDVNFNVRTGYQEAEFFQRKS